MIKENPGSPEKSQSFLRRRSYKQTATIK